jgi:hypothetical protein
LWGLAVSGEAGVTQVLNLLNQELELTMTLAGCARPQDIALDLLYAEPMFRAAPVDGQRPADRTLRFPEATART